jgi:hypothetical protein
VGYGGSEGGDATQGTDSGMPDTATTDSGMTDGGGSDTGGGGDSQLDSAGDSVESDAGTDSAMGTDGPADSSPVETGLDASFVAPTCDGTIAAGEYGSVAHEQASGSGQTWYVTWDATNLYIAISGATVAEANILYLAANPADGGAGLTTGYAYDNTDVTHLPFAAGVVVYAKQSYDEARTVSASAWGTPNTTAVKVCTTGATATVREEVIPWSLLGGLPAAFGWTGYFAASPATNPAGYIYGQMPTDDFGGGDAGAVTFTKYYAVPNATPGVDAPFADEQ